MKHLTRDGIEVQRLLRKARRIAMVGASPRADRHSNTVCRYLHRAGFEVIPVRQDREEVIGLSSYASLAEVPGPLDLAVIYRGRSQAVDHVAEAAARGDLMAVWLPPGAVSGAALDVAAQEGLPVVSDRCPEKEYRHLGRPGGHNFDRIQHDTRRRKNKALTMRSLKKRPRRLGRGAPRARAGSR